MCSGLDIGLSCLYLRGMRRLPSVVSVLGGALVASLLTVPAVAAPAPVADATSAAVSSAPASTVGDAEVRRGPQEVTVDFVMALAAGSASFAPAGVSGEYRLTLRDAPPRVRVTELTTEKESASLPMKAFLVYWTGYGDVTGQFTKNPPRAVVQGTDASGDRVEVVVRLRDATREGSTVRFDAEVITNPKGVRKVEAKVDQVDPTHVGEHAVVSDPKKLTGVEVFVDMPPKIIQPEQEETAGTTVRQDAAAQTATPRTLTCHGVRSSRLRTCWRQITRAQAQTWPGEWRCPTSHRPHEPRPPCNDGNRWFQTSGPANGWIFEHVGVVDWGSHYWAPGPLIRRGWRELPPDADNELSRTEITYAVWFTTWWGVDTNAITWHTSHRCTWFLAKWSWVGECW
jgi:hypothetical protein